ncbi:MAG: hypothetical protein IPH30_09345 [Betaproteobacteria bacterium]|nr:hypothetical protein [Betaproteobacteria bacterium]
MTLGIAAAVLLALAWMIGVLGMVRLINNYRAHPERYPDAQGLSRWMGLTLGAGGMSFALCALAWGVGGIGEEAVGIWSGVTAASLVLAALGGLARYRRMPDVRSGEEKRR